jgi:rhomboid protease GluP
MFIMDGGDVNIKMNVFKSTWASLSHSLRYLFRCKFDYTWSVSEPQKTPRPVLWLGRMIGLTPTQIEWRWRKMRDRSSVESPATNQAGRPLAARKEAARPTQAVMCQWCRAAQSSDALRCSSCGKKMIGRIARSVRAMGMEIPPALSSTVIIAVACVVVYVMMLLHYPGSGLTKWKTSELLAHGALLHQDGFINQPWRLATACLLHIGVLHLAMNMLSLAQIGPMVESIFGRGRTLFLFVVTGVIGNVASLLLISTPVSAGASGAIMGLMGVAAGVGHRIPQGRGIEIRNHMLKWAGITMLLGFGIGADNAAHGGGFIAGGLLGMALPPARVIASAKSGTSAVLGAIGALVLGATAALALAKHATPHFKDPRMVAMGKFRLTTDRACLRLQQEPSQRDEILAQYGQDQDNKGSLGKLEATCGYVAEVLPRCAAYRATGDAVFTDEERSGDIATTRDYFDIWCATPTNP